MSPLRQKSATPEAQQHPLAPQFITALPDEICLQQDEKLHLNVQLEANPPAQIHWILDGRSLAEVLAESDFRLLADRNQSELVVEGGVKEGCYTVEASNAHGMASSSANVGMNFLDF